MPGNRVVLALLAAALPVAAVLVALTLPGIAPYETTSDSGRTIHEIYWVVYGIAAFIFVVVEASLLAFIVRYRRRRPDDDLEGPQIHGNTRVEVAWTLIPALILIVLATYTFIRVPTVEATGGASGGDVNVTVTAHQFYWQYEYGDGRVSYDTLYLPVDRRAVLTILSEDVDHSWWVPELTGKRDAIPGRTNVLRFTPLEAGTYESGVCGEFCGIQHARMTTDVEVMSQDDFDAWLGEQPSGGDTELGESQWLAACAKCHGVDGEGDIGPPIAKNSLLGDADALRQLLYEGQNTSGNEGYMPPVGKGWTDDQIETLIAYIASNDTLAPAGGQGGG